MTELRAALADLIAITDNVAERVGSIDLYSELQVAAENARAALAHPEPSAGLDVDHRRADLWADVVRFVRWSANVRDDDTNVIAVARALLERLETERPSDAEASAGLDVEWLAEAMRLEGIAPFRSRSAAEAHGADPRWRRNASDLIARYNEIAAARLDSSAAGGE